MAANLVLRASGPHLLYIAQCDRGATNQSRVGRPRSGRETKGPSGPLGPLLRSI
jgi:hypothetical protein